MIDTFAFLGSRTIFLPLLLLVVPRQEAAIFTTALGREVLTTFRAFISLLMPLLQCCFLFFCWFSVGFLLFVWPNPTHPTRPRPLLIFAI